MRVLLLNPPGERIYIRDYFCSKTTKSNYLFHPDRSRRRCRARSAPSTRSWSSTACRRTADARTELGRAHRGAATPR